MGQNQVEQFRVCTEKKVFLKRRQERKGKKEARNKETTVTQ